MKTGSIRERIALSTPIRESNGAGGYEITWDARTVNAVVTPLGVSRLSSMGMKWELTQLRMNQSFEFKIVDRPGLILTEETKITYKGHDLTVHSLTQNLEVPKQWVVLAVNNTGAK